MSQNGKKTKKSEDDERTARFVFENKVFAVAGGYFTRLADKSQAVFVVPLGEALGTLSLKTLRANFGIAPNSPDDFLLNLVDDSLRFVKEIYPGESIPRELLDGTASWSVEEHHRARARGRMTIQLASWISGRELVVTRPEEIDQLAGDEGIRRQAEEAHAALVSRLKLAPGDAGQVTGKLDGFIHELAYIEALRESFERVRMIQERLQKFQQVYRVERTIVADIIQMLRLVRSPIEHYDSVFLQVDGQTGQILSLLKTYERQVEFTRRMRDELHSALMDWDQMIDRWDAITFEQGAAAEALLKDTYRFLAQRFLQTNVWSR